MRGGKEVSEHSEDSGKTSLQDTPPEQVWKGQVILPGPRMAHQGIYDCQTTGGMASAVTMFKHKELKLHFLVF